MSSISLQDSEQGPVSARDVGALASWQAPDLDKLRNDLRHYVDLMAARKVGVGECDALPSVVVVLDETFWQPRGGAVQVVIGWARGSTTE